ncbi:MAG: UDP-N-acetylmuramoyl-L-alanine--D-glutamate ligase [Myxococcota bacterium]|nr:UDP-N-acetylmuramoyl-L-alanine--D-glutamate ligase [Myxococcota bacterium]
MNLKGRTVAVWGAARSGVAAANLLVTLGAEVILSDNRSFDALSLDTLDARVSLECGGNVLADADILIPSPGIKPSTRALQNALISGVTLCSEIELAAAFAKCPIVAITGTDGKSTTTEMIGSLVEGTGRRAIVAGNIGVPFCERVLSGRGDDVFVVEVSAFQLWSCSNFSPQIAVITNIAEDHAEYFDHDTAAYIAAKERILQDMVPGSHAILRGDDPSVAQFTTKEGVHRILFGPNQVSTGWGFDGQCLLRNGVRVMDAKMLSVPGRHNVYIALAALAVGDSLGLDREAAIRGLTSFQGLPHRLQLVCQKRGVYWYNDSKATNPHAASVGLKAIERDQIVITGGYEKNLDLSPFIGALGRARQVYTVGPTSDRLTRAVDGQVPIKTCKTLFDAVQEAASLARPNDAVILSPAASSFDAYKSYAHRGECFNEFVLGLPG